MSRLSEAPDPADRSNHTIGSDNDDGADAAGKRAALDTPSAGPRATVAGLVAQLRVVNRDDNIAAVVLADGTDLDLIVLGTRGLGGREVTEAGQRLARRPATRRPTVLVVPSPSPAEQGHHWAEPAEIAVGIT